MSSVKVLNASSLGLPSGAFWSLSTTMSPRSISSTSAVASFSRSTVGSLDAARSVLFCLPVVAQMLVLRTSHEASAEQAAWPGVEDSVVRAKCEPQPPTAPIGVASPSAPKATVKRCPKRAISTIGYHPVIFTKFSQIRFGGGLRGLKGRYVT